MTRFATAEGPQLTQVNVPLSRFPKNLSKNFVAVALSELFCQIKVLIRLGDNTNAQLLGFDELGFAGFFRRQRRETFLEETESMTLPPARRTRAAASSRESVGRVPVMTTVCPVNGPLRWRSNFWYLQMLLQSREALISAAYQVCTELPMMGPMPSICERDLFAAPSALERKKVSPAEMRSRHPCAVSRADKQSVKRELFK